MFDKYILVDGSLRSTADGFSFDVMLGYYRGLGLSMIEDLVVSVDGQAVPRDAILFDEGKGPIALCDMEHAYDRRWPFGSKATIMVQCPQPLAAGDHHLSLKEVLRISYLPFPLVAEDSKTLTLAPTLAA
ncbi:DUF6379 domain-containing protein [Sphingobium sp. HBC34]|uniref:C-deglycosylation enzyme beta subunit n=1 Tax=Sphingobium cyanobacteriorum TaxID=3063954 RepID=A0ABT8ZHY2_9SPHN|nr:DUF6379 domain-containing protein [Sphingobium sp. HBC34]MDO7834150.1 DUF6379 domain-containing protein [Sphingobium sp. HBC34]